MIINNLKLALRNLWKNKVSTIINVFGLTIGLTSLLLISIYIRHEASFDDFQQNGRRIVRVIMEYGFDGSNESKRGNFTSTKVAPEFSRTFPEVELGVRMRSTNMIIKHSDRVVTEPYFMFADSTFFRMFSNNFVHGNARGALNGPFKIVLSESAANRYFKDEDPIGKLLLIGTNEKPYEVTGVVQNYPTNSQIKFDFLASFSSLGANQEQTYFDANYTTYLLLKENRVIASLQKKIGPFMKKEMAGTGAFVNFILEPFDRIHLHSEYAGFVPNTSITYLYILSAVALLILIIVSFTYINLSTARALERAKEVGIRKSIGAGRSDLFWQFINESFLLCATGVLLSYGLLFLTLPYFNQLIEKQLPVDFIISLPFIGFCLLVTVALSFLAGSYPAIVLTGFQPVKVLKGITRQDSGKWIQHALIVFQFSVSVFLVAGTLIIQDQLFFIRNKSLGFDRERIIVLPMYQQMLDVLPVIKQELKANAAVLHVSRCVSTPVHIPGGYNMRSAAMGEHEQHPVTGTPIDEAYIQTTGLKIIAGSDLTEQDIKDVAHENSKDRIYHFILNESAARDLGWTPDEAVGKKMFMDHREGFVKGVIQDFHFESMHYRIKPLILFPDIHGRGNLLVKVSGKDLPETVLFVESKWKQLIPSVPFEYHFLDEDYNALYKSEMQLGTVMNLFSAIAIMLACLGLFGLSTFVAQQRIKEIGIRKILGASVANIVALLNGKFTLLVIVSIVIATPLAYLSMDQWLQGFAYRTEITTGTFALTAFAALLVALVTVSIQSIKAAFTNPSQTLKSE